MLRDVATLIGAFALGTLVALAFGAANLGVALGVGQVVFVIVLMWVLLRPSRS